MLGWLQEDPGASAVAWLDRLQVDEPDRFSPALLRILQWRVRKWRGIMVNKLVYGVSDELFPELRNTGDLTLVGVGTRARISVAFPNEATGSGKSS